MNQIHVRHRGELVCRPSERFFPRRVDPLKAAIGSGNAQQVDRERKESIEGRGALVHARFQFVVIGRDPFGHRVEGIGELSNLVAATSGADPPRVFAGRNRGRRRREIVERCRDARAHDADQKGRQPNGDQPEHGHPSLHGVRGCEDAVARELDPRRPWRPSDHADRSQSALPARRPVLDDSVPCRVDGRLRHDLGEVRPDAAALMSDRDERAVADQAIQRVSRLGRRQRPAHDDVAERSARSWVPPVCGRRLVRDFGDQSVENRVVRALKGRETWNERYRCVQRRSLATGGSDLQHAPCHAVPGHGGARNLGSVRRAGDQHRQWR